MNAITLHQPWASLMALGYKQIETRGWPAPAHAIGQPIAIHAGKEWNDTLRGQCGLQPFSWCLLGEQHYFAIPQEDEDALYEALPRSAVLAVGTLASCRQVTARQHPPPDGTYEWYFGAYGYGRWMWWIKDIRMLAQPAKASGARGVWCWDAPAALLADLAPPRPLRAMQDYQEARLLAQEHK